MAKLTYWKAECLRDSSVYNVRAKTKKEAIAQREERGAEDFGDVEKVTIFYKDAFDLMDYVSSEAFYG